MSNSEDAKKSHSETTTHLQLVQELAMIKMIFDLTGKINPNTLQMLIQSALLADILVRQKEEADKTPSQSMIDLQTESFAKDIEIAALRSQLADKEL